METASRISYGLVKMPKENHEFLNRLGKRIAELRKRKNMSQETLADAIDVHRTYVGFIEQGKRNPIVGNIYKISKALNVELTDLFKDLD